MGAGGAAAAKVGLRRVHGDLERRQHGREEEVGAASRVDEVRVLALPAQASEATVQLLEDRPVVHVAHEAVPRGSGLELGDPAIEAGLDEAVVIGAPGVA